MMRAAAIAALALLASCSAATPAAADGQEPVEHGLPLGTYVFADPDTGCQYFAYGGKFITPRYEAGASGTFIKGCRQ